MLHPVAVDAQHGIVGAAQPGVAARLDRDVRTPFAAELSHHVMDNAGCSSKRDCHVFHQWLGLLGVPSALQPLA